MADAKRYWVDNHPSIRPGIEDIDPTKTPVVRVMRRSPPFALGEAIAFFVGPQAVAHAKFFVESAQSAALLEEVEDA